MIQVVERFHKIMIHVALAPETPVTLAELAKLIDVSNPTCANIVKTMTELGYLKSLGSRKGYIMGATPFYIVRNGHFRKYLLDSGREIVAALAKDINELVVLVTECDGKRIELFKQECESLVQVKSRDTVNNFSLLNSATGTLLSAYKSDEEFRHIWDLRNTDEGNLFRTNDFNEANKLRKKIAAKGFFICEPETEDEELLQHESVTLAVPIYENGEVVATIGSRIPMYRFNAKRKQMIVEKCLTAAECITKKLESTEK